MYHLSQFVRLTTTLEDDAAHPLLNCSVKVCITIGKKKSWFPAVVTQYKVQKNNSSEAHHLLLSYEDEDEKWHILDCHTDDSSLEQGHEGSFGKCIQLERQQQMYHQC